MLKCYRILVVELLKFLKIEFVWRRSLENTLIIKLKSFYYSKIYNIF